MIKIKTWISNVVRTTRFWKNLRRVSSKSKTLGSQIFLKLFGNKKTYGPNKDSQN